MDTQTQPITGTWVAPGSIVVREEVVERDLRGWPRAVAFPIGVLAALLGLAPWLITGAALPQQTFWAATGEAMPFALLPFGEAHIIHVFAFVIVGAAAAGVAGRALRLRGWASALLELGVLTTQGIALVQTSLAVRDGLREGLDSVVYLGALAGGTTLTILAGIAVTMLIVAAPRAGALLGLTAGAIAVAWWTGALIAPIGAIGTPPVEELAIVPWIAPVLTGAAIAWAGVHSAGRVIAAVTALMMVWLAQAVIAGTTGALGARLLVDSAGEFVEYGVAAFQTALFTPAVALPPVLVTVAVAGIGLLARGMIARARRARS